MPSLNHIDDQIYYKWEIYWGDKLGINGGEFVVMFDLFCLS